MSRQSPLIRQWILLRTLCVKRCGITVQELAQEMGVGEKTIRRDLEAFLLAGFPLTETVGRFGRKSYSIDRDKNQPGMSFAFDEAIALYLGRRFIEPLAGTIFWDASQRAFKKIRATLGKKALKYVDQFATIFHQTAVGASDYSRKAELIDLLMQGIEERRAMFITYRSLRATESVTYDIYPFGMTYHRGSLYLVGRKVERGLSRLDVPSPAGRGQGEGIQGDENPIRHWKVDRIEDASLEELRFERPTDFDMQSHFANSFGVYQGDGAVHVKVRFAPTVARYVEESVWHASQKLTKQKDGSLLAEFDLDGTEEIMRWILSFGQHAEVVEPEELRNTIVGEAQSITMLYATKEKRKQNDYTKNSTSLPENF